MKYVIYIVLVLLMSLSVFAATQEKSQEIVVMDGDDELPLAVQMVQEQRMEDKAAKEVMVDDDEKMEDSPKPELIAAKPENTGKPEIAGLAKAIEMVSNPTALAALEANLEKIKSQLPEDATDIEISDFDEESGEIQVKAKEPVKYLGFIKGKATMKYSVNAQGSIEANAPWYRFLYAKQ